MHAKFTFKRILAIWLPLSIVALLSWNCNQQSADSQDSAADKAGEAEAALPLNTLTEAEKEAGWELLFDGKSTAGWHSYLVDTVDAGWIVDEGALSLNGVKQEDSWRWETPGGGYILTDREFENFDLQLEWKITECGNSGVIFLAVEDEKYAEPWRTGPEMQILDNTCHPDREFPTHRAGSLYDLIQAQPETVKPAGEWNQARILLNKGQLELWLNGEKVVETEMWTEEWNGMVANSKFGKSGHSDYSPDYAVARRGRIALQDHNDSRVWFRNIKIKEFKD